MCASKLTTWIPQSIALSAYGVAVASYFAVGLLTVSGRIGFDGSRLVLPPFPSTADASVGLFFLGGGVLVAHEFLRLLDALRSGQRLSFSGKYYFSFGVLLHSGFVAAMLAYLVSDPLRADAVFKTLFVALLPVYGLLTLWVYERVDPEEA